MFVLSDNLILIPTDGILVTHQCLWFALEPSIYQTSPYSSLPSCITCSRLYEGSWLGGSGTAIIVFNHGKNLHKLAYAPNDVRKIHSQELHPEGRATHFNRLFSLRHFEPRRCVSRAFAGASKTTRAISGCQWFSRRSRCSNNDITSLRVCWNVKACLLNFLRQVIHFLDKKWAVEHSFQCGVVENKHQHL